MWLVIGVVSSFFLGLYDVSKKVALKGNDVLPVLFFATVSGALVFTPFVLISHFFPAYSVNKFWYVAPVDLTGHLYFFLKSSIVSTSWLMAYFGIKRLPLTIVAPITAATPMWTMVGAMFIFGERLGYLQWIGILVTITFYYVFSLTGIKEGINFRKNKWVWMLYVSTVISSCSALFDKFLVKEYPRVTMQAFFSIYLVVIFFPIYIFYKLKEKKEDADGFRWKPAVSLIGIVLSIADFAYFFALSYQSALISIVAALRRGSIVVSFSTGAIIFKEKNIKSKALALLGILVGIALIILGSMK